MYNRAVMSTKKVCLF